MPGWICSIILLAILSPFFLFLFFYASVRCFQFIYRQNSGGAGRQDVRSPVLGNRPSLTDREKALEAARAVGQPQQPKVSSLHKYRSLNHASAYSPPFFPRFSLFFFPLTATCTNTRGGTLCNRNIWGGHEEKGDRNHQWVSWYPGYKGKVIKAQQEKVLWQEFTVQLRDVQTSRTHFELVWNAFVLENTNVNATSNTNDSGERAHHKQRTAYAWTRTRNETRSRVGAERVQNVILCLHSSELDCTHGICSQLSGILPAVESRQVINTPCLFFYLFLCFC